jgi:hypothetical protein
MRLSVFSHVDRLCDRELAMQLCMAETPELSRGSLT